MKKKSIMQKLVIFIMTIMITAGIFPGRTTPVKAAGDVSDPMVGQICLLPYSRTPAGWMECDGRSLSVAEYQELYATIGNSFGGNYYSFNLPDLSIKAPIAGTKYYIACEGSYGVDNLCPVIGEVCLFPDSAVPEDSFLWELCDGKTLNTSEYQPLYSLITTTYGGTSTAFKIPNLLSKSPLDGTNYYIAKTGLYPSATGGLASEAFIGNIELYAFSFIPQSTYYCNGQTVAIIYNNALYSLVGNTFGGSGTTFAIPNLLSTTPSIKMKYCMRMYGIYPNIE